MTCYTVRVSFEGVGRVNPSISLCCPSLKKYYGDSYLPPYFTTRKFRPPLNNFLNETLTVLCMLRSMT